MGWTTSRTRDAMSLELEAHDADIVSSAVASSHKEQQEDEEGY